MSYLITFVVTFTVMFLLHYFVVVNRKKGLELFKKGKQIKFFKNAYKLKIKDYKSFATSLSCVNAFIIAFTLTLTELVDNIILKFIVAFFLIIILILICYYILNIIYKRKSE